MSTALVPTPTILKIEVDTPGGWSDVTGPGTSVNVTRADSEPGTLQLEILDAGLDPRTTAAIRLGKAARVSAHVAGVWQPFFTGNLSNIEVDENPLAPEAKRINVRLTAVDHTATLANLTEPRGVATIDELRWLLDGSGVPFLVNGNSTTLATGTVVARNDNAGLWDQILITRDSNLGYAWVDMDNRLNVNDPTAMDATTKATLTPATYRDIDVDFALDQIINSVVVNWRRYNIGTETAADVPYGPYENALSIADWGRRQATFTVQGATEVEADIEAFANDVLDRNKDAEVRARSVTIVLTTGAQLALVRDVDLNSRVSVEHPDGTTQTLRVVGIQHTITPTRWTLTYELAKPLALTQPSQTPPTGIAPIPPGSIGTEELTDDVLDSIQGAYDAADVAAAAAADAALNATTALDAANGKNKVTFSTSAPGSTANNAGDIWFQKDSATQTIIGQWEGLGGSSWSQKTIRNEVIANLDAGKLIAGSAFVNALWVKTNLTLGDASTNGVIQSHNFAGSSVGVYIDKYGLVAKGGTITGATIQGADVLGGTVQGADVYISQLYPDSGDTAIDLYGGLNVFNAPGKPGNVSIAGTLSVGLTATVSNLTCNLDATVNGNVFVHGIATNTNATVGNDVRILGSGGLVKITSSERYKRNIRPADLDPAAVLSIEPKRYEDHLTGATGIGFIAERVHDAGLVDFVAYDDHHRPETVPYPGWVIAQQAALRHLYALAIDLQGRVTAMEAA